MLPTEQKHACEGSEVVPSMCLSLATAAAAAWDGPFQLWTLDAAPTSIGWWAADATPPLLSHSTYLSSIQSKVQSTNDTSDTMRLSSITAAFGLLAAGASALDKPLNTEVLKAVECSRKTKTGTPSPSPQPSPPTAYF